jgi:Fe2+ transport system protein FeoA
VIEMAERVISAKDLRRGMRARIESVGDEEALHTRLLELVLIPGTEFKVTKIAPLGDPMELELRGYRLCVRQSEVECLRLVELD